MLIYKNENKYYIFIHIPKNSGKYIRLKIKNNPKNIIINSYWDCDKTFDLAHIPYLKKINYIENNIEYNYFAHSRCPYNRIISAFSYKNLNKNPNNFKDFVKNVLTTYNFDINFNHTIIHYYPQYLFVCDENFNIPENIKIDKIEDIESPRKYDLSDYFDNSCINIINDIYSKDFLFFNYQMITSI